MNRKTQSGSALIYILIAIALLAALTAVFMTGNSDTQTSKQSETMLVKELQSQIAFIRTAIDECVLNYPNGDTTMPQNPVGGQPVNRPYPLQANNVYLLNPSSAGVSLVKDIRCPGNPGNSNNHAKIFSGASAKFLPPAPNLFTDWWYYNDVGGVFFTIITSSTDAYLKAALQKLDAQYSKCETQFIDATSMAKVYDGWDCALGTMCFRVWIKPNSGATYTDETGCP